MTHSTVYLFDQKVVGDFEDAVEAMRKNWDDRVEHISSPRLIEAGESRLTILESVTQLLRDAV